VVDRRGYSQTGIELLDAELAKRGIGPIGATGAIAGIMGESGANLDPTSFNSQDPGGGSGGIGQWNRGRLIGPNGMLAFAQSAGVPNINVNNPLDAKKVPLTTQVQFLGHELDTPAYAGVRTQLQAATSPQEALNVWVNSYENPQDKQAAIAQRSQYLAPVGTTLNSTLAMAQNAPVSTTPGTASAGITGSPASIAATSAAGATGVVPGFVAPQASNQFLQGASTLDKAFGGKGAPGQPGQGAGAEPVRPSPMIPGPQAIGVSPLIGQAMATYGQTLNSMRQPLQWGPNTPGSGSPFYASAGPQTAASNQGLETQELQQLQQLSNPMMLQMMGMGYG